jgi:hypothetical protein
MWVYVEIVEIGYAYIGGWSRVNTAHDVITIVILFFCYDKLQ